LIEYFGYCQPIAPIMNPVDCQQYSTICFDVSILQLMASILHRLRSYCDLHDRWLLSSGFKWFLDPAHTIFYIALIKFLYIQYQYHPTRVLTENSEL